MSPTFNASTVLQRFEHNNAIEMQYGCQIHDHMLYICDLLHY